MIFIIESFEGLRKFNEVVCNTPCTCFKVYRAWEEAGCTGKLVDDYGYHYTDCERSKVVRSLLWVKIVNDGSGTKKKGNYVWSVGNDETVLAEGKAKGHQRAKGWKKLLKKVTNAVMKVPEKEPEQPDLPFTPEHDA